MKSKTLKNNISSKNTYPLKASLGIQYTIQYRPHNLIVKGRNLKWTRHDFNQFKCNARLWYQIEQKENNVFIDSSYFN